MTPESLKQLIDMHRKRISELYQQQLKHHNMALALQNQRFAFENELLKLQDQYIDMLHSPEYYEALDAVSNVIPFGQTKH